MKPFRHFRHSSRYKRSSALVITLVALVLITLLVVSLSSMIGLERNSTHEAFESQRAREFGNMAVDEVVATLRDSIPANSLWAAAPGKIEYYATPAATTTTTVSLFSGLPSLTGEVDLNAPILGSTSSYPIISPNSEYGVTPMLMGWIEVLQDNKTGTITFIRPGTASNTDRTKSVVGRYAYWVDTETSKVNVNTAGKGQTTYTFDPTNYINGVGKNDLQNLTGSPSRVDLSQLDGGITPAQSFGLYHYTYGGYWMPSAAGGDYLGAPIFSTSGGEGNALLAPFDTVPIYPQGMHHLNSIFELTQVTNDLLFPSQTVTPITSTQIEENKFYLTTRSATPDVTPWGFNRMWLQSSDDMVIPSTSAWASTFGNKNNGKGVPFYPVSASDAQGFSPGQAFGRNGVNVSDTRYFAYPYLPNTSPNTPAGFQFAGQYDGSPSQVATFVNSMMVQMNRTDWPGFPGQSYVGKYGQAECEDFAYNLYCLADSCLDGGGAPNSDFLGAGTGSPRLLPNFGTNGIDYFGTYGTANKMMIDGKTRVMGGFGEFPLVTQVTTSIVPTQGGTFRFYNTNASPYAGTIAPFLNSSVTNYTKLGNVANGNALGFSPSVVNQTNTSLNLMQNVAVMPTIQVVYPKGFRNPSFWRGSGGSRGGFRLVDIAIYAQGTYNNAPVTYGSNSTVDSSTNHPYYFGCLDDFGNSGLGPSASQPNTPGPGHDEFDSQGLADHYYPVAFPGIFVGPFDKGTTVKDVQVRFRVVCFMQNGHSMAAPYQIAPIAFNAYTNEDQCFTNVMSSASSNTNYAPTFMWEATNIDLTSASATYQSYEVTDPRVYRYISDWTQTQQSDFPPSSGATSIYTGSYTDGLTGVTGDNSKLAWPDIGAIYFNDGAPGYNPAYSGFDLRAFQSANHIVGLPGVGWLSLLPLNSESSQNNGSGDPNHPGQPVPWRTLSLQPFHAAKLPSGGQLPDWLLFDAFAIAYDQTFCSHTQGKINVNLTNVAFPSIPLRTKPLQALLTPSSYAAGYDYPTLDGGSLAADIGKGQNNSSYVSPGGNLPGDILMYPGQLCQYTSLAGNGTNQWQQESLLRSIMGTITTKSSDFKVHVVAQSVKQTSFTGNPANDLQITGEQRMNAIISRAPNFGPANVPDVIFTQSGAADEPAYTTNNFLPASSIGPGVGISSNVIATTPNYRYTVSDLNYINN